ncbi:ParA family protein [Acaricomes phytoseiuli]|uniref:ParA family protein n=1 Tax=Acaricomes phytoseiuli TaxID=291968 RepID=UPI000377EE4F|nr:ParA family protein [Acaricomes phytoseiuli]
MTRIEAFANNKGGVGKTMVCLNFGVSEARRGKRVLFIDMDPQSNLSRRLGVEYDPSKPTVTSTEVIKSGELGAGEQAVQEVEISGVTVGVLPSRPDLENRISEAGILGAVSRLANALAGGWLQDQYDLVCIDTQPSFSHLTQMAFAAATGVQIVTIPEFEAVEGAMKTQAFVEEKSRYLMNPELRVTGLIVNGYQSLGEHDDQMKGIRDHFGDLWRQPAIKYRSVVKDSVSAAGPNNAISIYSYETRAARLVQAAFDIIATQHSEGSQEIA